MSDPNISTLSCRNSLFLPLEVFHTIKIGYTEISNRFWQLCIILPPRVTVVISGLRASSDISFSICNHRKLRSSNIFPDLLFDSAFSTKVIFLISKFQTNFSPRIKMYYDWNSVDIDLCSFCWLCGKIPWK